MIAPDKLLSPAVDWTGQTWIERIDQCASMLFVHGYIPASVRERVGKRLEKEGAAALADRLAKLRVEQGK